MDSEMIGSELGLKNLIVVRAWNFIFAITSKMGVRIDGVGQNSNWIYSEYNNNNNHGSTALYGLGPPLASSFRGLRIRDSW
jgi:hypothetical protein